MYTIMRDGKTIVDGLLDEFAVMRWFHLNCNQSMKWMCQWEGYSIRKA